MPFLDWVNKNQAKAATRKVPYHLLRQESVHGNISGHCAENMLIQGDNLLALKALVPFYAGRVKCIFIDPPYNTQSAFEHYDDRLEHSQWLSMMYPRLVLLRELLSEDGSIWVTLDDNEAHYFKVLLDEVFGRSNFVANVIWEKSDSPKMDSHLFSTRHDHLFVFAKNKSKFTLKRLVTETAAHYDKRDESGRLYYLKPLRAMGGQGDSRASRPNLFYPLTAPDGVEIYPIRADGKEGAWRWSKDKTEQEIERIEWRKGRNGWSVYFRIYADSSSGRPPETIWTHSEVGSNRTSKNEVKALLTVDGAFTTPKPEALLKRILDIASNPADIVLDSFLGSGTTAAVAHKMGRRYIGIEMGQQAITHCLPRLIKVIEGEKGGVSDEVAWSGGGGFRFCSLGATAFDEDGRINKNVSFSTLAAFIWHSVTGAPGSQVFDTPFLGVNEGTAYYLLFNGILGDRKPAGGNVLTREVLEALYKIYPHDGPKVVFGETSRLGPARLASEQITFKQIPYDVSVRS